MADEMTATSEPAREYAKPSEGAVQAVCVDVIDLGFQPHSYQGIDMGTVRKCLIVWQVNEINPDEHGQRHIVAKEFTFSMSEKANLRKFLGMWRGKSYTDAEAMQGVALHKLVGVNCILQLEHKPSKANPGRSYVNLIGITPLMKGMPLLKPSEYARPDWLTKRFQPSAQPFVDQGAKPAAPQATRRGHDEPPPPDDSDYPSDYDEDSMDGLPF